MSMYDWYTRYYLATEHSAAYAQFCTRVFGRNFAQHGFSDMAQINRLLDLAALRPRDTVLDLGCGNGAMASYIVQRTGAHVTGIDYIPAAIRQANERAAADKRLRFAVMDIGALSFPPASFDAIISIDTLYFTDLTDTIGRLKRILRRGGQMLIYFAHGVSPDTPRETFDPATLAPGHTPLAAALTAHGLSWQTWDMTDADAAHARLKLQVIEELRPELEAGGNGFLYDNRAGEARGVLSAIADGLHRRYLYRVRFCGP